MAEAPLLIAAAAGANGVTLYARNPDDFADLDDLDDFADLDDLLSIVAI